MSAEFIESDRESYGTDDTWQSVDDEDQLQPGDTLDDRGVSDVLDEGYSPPDREPAHLRHGVTRAEQRDGPTLDEWLAAEVPEPDPYAEEVDPGVADRRAGRLVALDQGSGYDEYSDEVAREVGIDGAAASAEEAAVHVIGEDFDDEDLPEDLRDF